MPSPRDVLNRLRFTGQALDEVVVEYLHRGAPGDRRAVRASEIREMGRGFFSLAGRDGGSSIPWHRVLLVRRGEEILFDRHRPQ